MTASNPKLFTPYVLLSVQKWLMVVFSNKKGTQESPPDNRRKISD